MSSSRSDNVTPFVCPFICPLVPYFSFLVKIKLFVKDGVMSEEVQEYVSNTLRACGSMLGAGMEHISKE